MSILYIDELREVLSMALTYFNAAITMFLALSLVV